MNHNDSLNPQRPSLIRRAAAMFYDFIALLAVWFFATLLVVLVLRGQAVIAENPFFFLYLVLVTYSYFGYCWTRGGQTLGMKAWKIRLVGDADAGVTWKQSAIRFFMAWVSALSFGAGYLWCVFSAPRRTWHGLVSRTRLKCV